MNQIANALDPEKEIFVVLGDYLIVMDLTAPKRMKLLFQRAGTKFVYIDVPELLKFLVKRLAPHINIEDFLTELIALHSSAEEIIELKERLEKGAKVTPAPRCYSLMVAGKRGRPYEFNLVG